MIRDVTTNWQRTKAGKGVYILRGRDDPFKGVIRVGAGGINGGAGGLFGRLNGLLKPRSGSKTCGTHECQPFDLIHAWELADWSVTELANGEHCLYRALAVRFPRRTVGLPDDSLFLVSEEFDLAPVLAELQADLETIESLW